MAYSEPEYIHAITPYVPGKSSEILMRERGLSSIIRMDSNENPMGPPKSALEALKTSASNLHRYPDGSATFLKDALSEALNISAAHFIIGNGSNEIIDLLIRSFCVPGDAIVAPKYAFIAYRMCAQIHGVKTIESAVTTDLRADLSDMANTVRNSKRAKIIFIANPNNPTGTYNTKEELKTFLTEITRIRGDSITIVLDYAYWEYVTASDLPDPLELFKLFPNLVILRTFSKAYALAGLRVGYGIAPLETVRTLEKVRQPFNINSQALSAAVAAFNDTAFIKESKRLNSEAIAFWEKELKMREIPFWASQGNFILIDVQNGLGKRGNEVYLDCLEQGVVFRPTLNYGLPQALRISMGTMIENRSAIRALLKE